FERRLRAITDRLFFKQRYEYSHVVQILSETLNATLAIEQLVPRVVRKLKYLFRTRSACVYLVKSSIVNRFGANLCDDAYCRKLVRLFHVRPYILIRADLPFILADRQLPQDLRNLLGNFSKEPTLANVELGVPIFS